MKLFLTAFLFIVIANTGNAQNSLFKKYKANPLFDIGSDKPAWRAIHVANATILYPEETSDGTWRIYIRGSGRTPDYHDQIGLLYQDSASFSPYGPWLEYENNPVIEYGPPGSYDDLHLLDCAPVVGKDNEFYFFYKAVSKAGRHTLAGAKSVDGGFTFEKFDTNPLKSGSGGSDAIYHDGQYYIYYSNTGDSGSPSIYVKITDTPEKFAEVDSIKVLTTGGGPNNFDSYSVAAGRIFFLEDKWYMVYPGSNRHFDFPDKFHVAYSDDLINWNKIDNDFPLMERGPLGSWDQGAIWYGEVFQHQDSLYMLYEAWGSHTIPPDRDVPYFPGNSRTGIASTSVKDFLLWADGGLDSTWIENDIPNGDPDGFKTIVDFENRFMNFYPTNNMPYQIVDNPFPDEVNPSQRCGRITTVAQPWALLWSDPLPQNFDFSGGSIFKMKVYTQIPGNVYFKIEHPTDWNLGQLEVQKQLSEVNKWVDMEFDFTPLQPASGLFGKIILLMDAGGTDTGNHWYFDDIRLSSVTTSVEVAEERYPDNMIIRYDRINQQLFLQGTSEYEPYVVFSIDGRAVIKGRGNQISVDHLRKGVYIIRTERSAVKFIK